MKTGHHPGSGRVFGFPPKCPWGASSRRCSCRLPIFYRGLAGTYNSCYAGAMATIDGGVRELDETRRILGLSQHEMADLFHIRQPSLAEWHSRGVPPARRASVGRLYDLARTLDAKIIATRIPEIVRTPDAWLDHRSMLEVIRAEGVAPIYDYLARLFSYTDDRR